ncbi:MAG: SdrD B-like domain-containing protein [Saprospiraceae bacterium]
MANVVVRLYYDTDKNGIPDGAEISNTLTNGNGYYIFNDLTAGSYVVKFEKPDNYYPSPKNHNGSDGCDDSSDSDGDKMLGYSDNIELGDNEHDPTII